MNNNFTKKLLSILLALVMSLSLMPLSAFADDAAAGDELVTVSSEIISEDAEASENEEVGNEDPTEDIIISDSDNNEEDKAAGTDTADADEDPQSEDTLPADEEKTEELAEEEQKYSTVKVTFICQELEDLSGLYVYNAAGREVEPYYDESIRWYVFDTYYLAPGDYTYTLHDEYGNYKDLKNIAFSVLDNAAEQSFTIIPEAAEKSAADENIETYSITVINPEYKDIIKEEDIPSSDYSDEDLAEMISEDEPVQNTANSNGIMLYAAYNAAESQTVHTSIADAGAELRQMLVSRNAEIKIYLKLSSSESWNSLCSQIYKAAVAHTGKSTEGDYLYFEYGGYTAQGAVQEDDGGGSSYIFVYTPLYYTTAAQERMVTSRVSAVLSQLSLSGKSDYRKIKAIYDYLCTNVSYDNANANNSSYTLKYTAYAALVNKTAVCQGYALAFYRLCLEAGVDARVISSTAMCHAWNIVQLGNNYYEMDSTWDAGRTNSGYRYFLRGSTYWLANHKYNGISVIGDEFSSSSFASKYNLLAGDAVTSFTIKYNAVGGTGAPDDQQKEIGESLTLSSTAPTRSGYEFLGWAAAQSASKAEYQPGDTYTADEDITLYAIWSGGAAPIHYRARSASCTANGNIEYYYNRNNGLYYSDSACTQEITDKTSVVIPALGHDFNSKGICTRCGAEDESKTEPETPEASAPPETAYSENYSISFNGNGSTSGKMSTEAMKVGTSKTLTSNSFARTGYTFVGWALAADGAVVYTNRQAVKDLVLDGSTLELYAVWTPNTYTINFSGNGGYVMSGSKKVTTYSQSTAAVYDKTITLDANAFTKAGYTFKEWNTRSNGKGISYTDCDSAINLTSSKNGRVTLYAIWEANTYTINFTTENGSGEVSSQTATYDKSIRLNANAFSYPGYTFKSWLGSNGKTYTDKASVRNLCAEHNGVITLTAVWTPNTYTVRFNSNGGRGSISSVKGSGDVPVVIPQNTYYFAGYKFVGWNTAKDGTGLMYSEGQNIVFDVKKNSTVTLYAIWEYTVTLDAGTGEGGTQTAELTYNKAATIEPEEFSKDGYYLAGWNKNAASAARGTVQYKITSVKNVGANTTLYAVWKQVK